MSQNWRSLLPYSAVSLSYRVEQDSRSHGICGFCLCNPNSTVFREEQSQLICCHLKSGLGMKLPGHLLLGLPRSGDASSSTSIKVPVGREATVRYQRAPCLHHSCYLCSSELVPCRTSMDSGEVGSTHQTAF